MSLDAPGRLHRHLAHGRGRLQTFDDLADRDTSGVEAHSPTKAPA
jgi:hypothetical protein